MKNETNNKTDAGLVGMLGGAAFGGWIGMHSGGDGVAIPIGAIIGGVLGFWCGWKSEAGK